MSCRDVVEFHEAGNFWVGFDLFSGFCSPSLGGVVSRGSPFSSLPRVSLVFGRVASFSVADETFSVSDVLCLFTGREIDLAYVHGVRIWLRGSASWGDIAVPSSSEFPESYYILVELSSLLKPLFPFPTVLSVRKGGCGHHDSKLLGYSSLEGIHQDAIIVDSAACLGQFEGGGVFVKVSIKQVHVEGINGLAGSVL